MSRLLTDIMQEVAENLNAQASLVEASGRDDLNYLIDELPADTPIIAYDARKRGSLLITPRLEGYLSYEVSIIFGKHTADDKQETEIATIDEMLELAYSFLCKLRDTTGWVQHFENQGDVSWNFESFTRLMNSTLSGVTINGTIRIYPNFDRELACDV